VRTAIMEGDPVLVVGLPGLPVVLMDVFSPRAAWDNGS
jgi:hypothetical protein